MCDFCVVLVFAADRPLKGLVFLREMKRATAAAPSGSSATIDLGAPAATGKALYREDKP